MADETRTRGAASLALWLRVRALTQSDLARILGIAPSTVLHWVRGSRTPRRAAAERLATLTGIAPCEWSHNGGDRE